MLLLPLQGFFKVTATEMKKLQSYDFGNPVTSCGILNLKPSGKFMYHQVVLTLRLCVLYVSQNKHQLLPYTTLTDWWSVFWRYAPSPNKAGRFRLEMI
jgi:hypothetical protein